MQVITAPTARTIMLLDGSVRSGKTIASIIRWLKYVAEVPVGAKLLMSGRTRESLRNNVLEDLFKIVGPKAYKYNYQRGELTLWGRKIRCVGANDEKSQDAIQGDTFWGWYGDEVTLYPRNFIDQGRARCSKDPGLILWTCNPDGPFHPIHEQFIDEGAAAVREGLVRRYHFVLDDNPGLPDSYKAQLKAGFTGLFYKRYILGLWVLAEGIIYDSFDLAVHGFDDAQAPKVFDRLVLTLDYGTQNPFHAILEGIKGDTSWALEEWRYCGRESERQMTDGEYSTDLRKWLAARHVEKVFVDPSAASFITQLKRDRWQGVTLADNDVVAGIRTVANRLTSGKLRIHRKRCPQLVKEMSTYAWCPKAAKEGEDKPLKQADHGPDALRYGEYTQFGKARPGPTNIDQLRRAAGAD